MHRTKSVPFLAAFALPLAIAALHSELKAARASLPPVVVVEANYPGANAAVVQDTVAAPIEQQINGVEGMLHMVSRSSGDGAYLLAVTFKSGTDLKMAQVLVQNRVALALPKCRAVCEKLAAETRPEVKLLPAEYRLRWMHDK